MNQDPHASRPMMMPSSRHIHIPSPLAVGSTERTANLRRQQHRPLHRRAPDEADTVNAETRSTSSMRCVRAFRIADTTALRKKAHQHAFVACRTEQISSMAAPLFCQTNAVASRSSATMSPTSEYNWPAAGLLIKFFTGYDWQAARTHAPCDAAQRKARLYIEWWRAAFFTSQQDIIDDVTADIIQTAHTGGGGGCQCTTGEQVTATPSSTVYHGAAPCAAEEWRKEPFVYSTFGDTCGLFSVGVC